MPLSNIDLFDQCLEHPEPLIDPFYCQDELIISSSAEGVPTPLMTANAQLHNRITAASVALCDGDEGAFLAQVQKIRPILEIDNINFTEFTSFFPTLDVSYSIYGNLSDNQKTEFLSIAVRIYIEKRHHTYLSHGYSATTLQVRKDFEKHKTGGSAANRKVVSLLYENGYVSHSGDQFSHARKRFVFGDAANLAEQIQAELKTELGLTFRWRNDHQEKNIDLFIVDASGQIHICEFKHMKESGGGQDKQVAELISLIRHPEENPRLGYIAFLDGIYFNSFRNPTAKKTMEQVRQIRQYLQQNPTNYFVNTYGLKALLRGGD